MPSKLYTAPNKHDQEVMPEFRDLLEQFLSLNLNSAAISPSKLEEMFRRILTGSYTQVEIAALLTAMRSQHDIAPLLTAGAKVMRALANKPNYIEYRLADNCGTGGDGAQSFNISTASAIVAASLGVSVAKHGNRSVSSKCGSADLLFIAGLPDKLSTEQTSTLLRDTNFTFFFAPHFHPGMKHVMPVRKELGIRTIFNVLGPLANPIAPAVQLIGVGVATYLDPVAKAALALGIERALIVHSRDGLDEISPCAITDCRLVTEGKIENLSINPDDFKIKATINGLAGGDQSENLKILHALLSGRKALQQIGTEKSAVFDAVCLNAGALLWLYSVAPNIESGFQQSKAAIEDGKAAAFFGSWIRRAQELAKQT